MRLTVCIGVRQASVFFSRHARVAVQSRSTVNVDSDRNQLMWVSEKAAQAFDVAWCPPCAMGQAKFKFWARIVLVLGQIQLSNFY
jgi:hypothetical protein